MSEEEDWEVEAICDDRVRGRAGRQYLVKWKGFPESENSWQSAADLAGAPLLVADYLAEKARQKEGEGKKKAPKPKAAGKEVKGKDKDKPEPGVKDKKKREVEAESGGKDAKRKKKEKPEPEPEPEPAPKAKRGKKKKLQSDGSNSPVKTTLSIRYDAARNLYFTVVTEDGATKELTKEEFYALSPAKYLETLELLKQGATD
jgi:outer membrane biosynthesis protein TonB